jgi:hypothetical protein
MCFFGLDEIRTRTNSEVQRKTHTEDFYGDGNDDIATLTSDRAAATAIRAH